MTQKTAPKYKVIPTTENRLQYETEMGISHSGFSEEYKIFLAIKNGDVENLEKFLTDYFSKEMVMGRMSGNTLRQVQYWAVATISIGTHYAILGGLDETDAFNTSDKVILEIDSCTDADEIFEIINSRAVMLTKMVQEAKNSGAESSAVKKCLHYIHLNLNRKIELSELAEICGLSENYLSSLFRKEIGISVSEYIHRQKIEKAKEMLASGESYLEISYKLGFSSESHFISIFKKITGMTPGKYCRL